MLNTIDGSTSKIFWPDFIFPPINLYNAPRQWIHYPIGKQKPREQSKPVIITQSELKRKIKCLQER